MPPKKKTDKTDKTDDTSPETTKPAPVRVDVRPKNANEWKALMAKAEESHWRRLSVKIQIRDRILAGKPAQLNAANAMLRARGLEDQIEAVPIDDEIARQKAAEQVVDEGLCEFHRRDGKPGIWFPTNNIKAGLKENWGVMGFRQEVRGSRGALAEGVFVYSAPEAGEKALPKEELDWVFLAIDIDGVHQAVAHTQGPKGPVASIKRHEFCVKPVIQFEIAIARAIMEKVPDEQLAGALFHFGEHGLGACRSQGFGKFDVLEVKDVEA